MIFSKFMKSDKTYFQLIASALLLLYSIHAIPDESSQIDQPYYRVAIIDRFFPPSEPFEDEEDRETHLWMYGVVDVDRDRVKEPLYHGDIVQIIAADPRIVFTRYPIDGKQTPMKEILTNLHVIIARMQSLPIDSLVLSWESSTLISAFGPVLEKENREQYIQTIYRWGETDEFWADTYRVIRALEALTLRGVKVYTIAGNSGQRTVNTLSFAKDIITVGAIEPELGHFIANNAFVDLYEKAAYEIKRIDDSNGKPIGYDVNNDGCEDIPIAQVSRTKSKALPKTVWPPIKGSSFAAPIAMKKALLHSQSEEKQKCATM